MQRLLFVAVSCCALSGCGLSGLEQLRPTQATQPDEVSWFAKYCFEAGPRAVAPCLNDFEEPTTWRRGDVPPIIIKR